MKIIKEMKMTCHYVRTHNLTKRKKHIIVKVLRELDNWTEADYK